MSDDPIISKMTRFRGTLLEVGAHTIIDDFSYSSADLRLGKYVHIAHSVTIIGGGHVCTIGDFSAISPGVRIVYASDDYLGGMVGPNIPIEFKMNPDFGDVTIGKHCIIGSNSVIMPDLVIPDGVAIGALSLVRRKDKLKPYALYAGVPLRFIRDREWDEALEKRFLERTES